MPLRCARAEGLDGVKGARSACDEQAGSQTGLRIMEEALLAGLKAHDNGGSDTTTIWVLARTMPVTP